MLVLQKHQQDADVHRREDGSHADVPTLGIREGQYYSGLHREKAAVAGRRMNDGEFVIAGHYAWDEDLNKARDALWLNPVMDGSAAPQFRFIGLRMGQLTR